MRDIIERYLRKAIPSTAKLSYNGLFRLAGNTLSRLPHLFFDEFRSLPKNHLRVRVGVGNKLFFNQVYHLRLPVNFWLNAFAAGMCRSDANIVDIGCGCGRYASLLQNYAFGDGDRYTGKYTGIDIDLELLSFCEKSFDPTHFTFLLSSHRSRTYSGARGPRGPAGEYYHIPLSDQGQDFVFSTSLFTHLLEEQLINYLQESYRILRLGGWMQMYVFCLDHMKSFLGARWTFSHPFGHAFVENVNLPEAAVAYPGAYLLAMSKEAGFSSCALFPTTNQSVLRCRK